MATDSYWGGSYWGSSYWGSGYWGSFGAAIPPTPTTSQGNVWAVTRQPRVKRKLLMLIRDYLEVKKE